MFNKTFRITNIECHSCVALATEALKDLSGVREVKIDKETGIAYLTAEEEIAWEDIRKTLAEIGKTSEEIVNT